MYMEDVRQVSARKLNTILKYMLSSWKHLHTAPEAEPTRSLRP